MCPPALPLLCLVGLLVGCPPDTLVEVPLQDVPSVQWLSLYDDWTNLSIGRSACGVRAGDVYCDAEYYGTQGLEVQVAEGGAVAVRSTRGIAVSVPREGVLTFEVQPLSWALGEEGRVARWLCFLQSAGTLWCPYADPVSIPALVGTNIVVAETAVCGVTPEGESRCVQGTTELSVPALGFTVDLVGAGNRVCARDEFGLVRCWKPSDPESVFLLEGSFASFDAFEGGGCGITAEGDVICSPPSGESATLIASGVGEGTISVGEAGVAILTTEGNAQGIDVDWSSL